MNSNYYVDTSYGYNAATTSGLVGGMLIFMALMWIISIGLSIFMVVTMWKVYRKLGKQGWECLIPIYNIYVLCEVIGKEWWYILLLFVPFANIYAMYVIYDGIAKKFGKETGFTIGMMFLPIIFFPILAFSKSANVIDNTMVNSENENLNNTNTVITENNANVSQESNLYNQPLENTSVGIEQNNQTQPISNDLNSVNVASPSPILPTQNDAVINDAMTNLNQMQYTNNQDVINDNSTLSENTQSNVNENVNQTSGLYQAPTFDNNIENVNVSNQVEQSFNNFNVSNNIMDFEKQNNQPETFSNNVIESSENINTSPSLPNQNIFNNQDSFINQPLNEPLNNSKTQDIINENILFEQNNNINIETEETKLEDANDLSNEHKSLWSNNGQDNTQM